MIDGCSPSTSKVKHLLMNLTISYRDTCLIHGGREREGREEERQRRIGIKLPRNRALNRTYCFYRGRSVFTINHHHESRGEEEREIKTRDTILWYIDYYYSIREKERERGREILDFCQRSIKPDNEGNYSTGRVISILIDRVSLFNRLVIIRGPEAL